MKKAISIVLATLLVVSCCVSLTACGKEEKHTCMKCGGTGVVRDKYGYYAYVTCPRCNGVGYLIY